MANTAKNIVITPSIGSDTEDPNMVFRSGGNTANITMTITDTGNGTLTFSGKDGPLFRIVNDGNLTFSVNDSGGVPFIEGWANSEIILNRASGNTQINGQLKVTTLNLNSQIVTNASQTFMEAGTLNNVFVTPAVAQFHPSAAKFWVKCDVAAAIQSSYNVTSVTDVGTGQLVINITNGFSSTNWVCLAQAYGAPSRIITANSNSAQATNTIKLSCASAGTTYADPVNWFAAGYGDR